MLLQYLRESLQDRHPEKYAPLADLSWVLAKNPALFLVPGIRIDVDHARGVSNFKVMPKFTEFMASSGVPSTLKDLHLTYPRHIHYSMCDAILNSSHFSFERLFVKMGGDKRSLHLPSTIKEAVVEVTVPNFTLHLQENVSRLTYINKTASTRPRTLRVEGDYYGISQLCLQDNSGLPFSLHDLFLRKLSVQRLSGSDFKGVEVEALKIRSCFPEDIKALLVSIHTLELGGLTRETQRQVLEHLNKYHYPKLSRVYLKGRNLDSRFVSIHNPQLRGL